MKLRIDPTIYNSDRTRKQALKEVREPIKDSLRKERAKKKLFKVKRIHNSDLYGDSNTQGEHLVLTVAINPRNNDVGTVTITSVEDAEGNPTKIDQINRGLIMELPEDKTKNFSRKVGIQQSIITRNVTTGNLLNHSMLEEPLYGASVDKSISGAVSDFLLNNPEHQRSSRKNYQKIRNYIKIK